MCRNKSKNYIRILLTLALCLTAGYAIADRSVYTYDSYDRLEQVVYDNGPVVKYQHDSAGNMDQASTYRDVLHVDLDSGSGFGNVSSNYAADNCGAGCYIFGSATTVTLSATADESSVFMNWSGGGCSGNGNCTVNVNDITSVVALFSGCGDVAAKLGSSHYYSIQDAYNAAGANDVIKSQAINVTESLDFNRDITVTISGGYDCDYASVTGETVINGDVTLGDGSVEMSDVLID